MDKAQVDELLYQALETEKGGVKVYQTAIRCAKNADLKEEWEKYLEQTRTTSGSCRDVCASSRPGPEKETPGRPSSATSAQSLVKAMEMALRGRRRRRPSSWPRVRRAGRDQGPPELGADRQGRRAARRATRAKALRRRPTTRSRTRRTSTSTTPPAGAGSCGSSRWSSRGAAAARRGEGSQDGHRRRPRQGRAQTRKEEVGIHGQDTAHSWRRSPEQ